MIVIGVDAHKRTHTLVALDAATGAVRGQRLIQGSDDGALVGLRFAARPAEARLALRFQAERRRRLALANA